MRDPERFIRACDGLDVHLEFGLQTIHEAEMQAVERRQSVPRFEELLGRLHHAHIDFEASLIYGLPEQTIESFRPWPRSPAPSLEPRAAIPSTSRRSSTGPLDGSSIL